MTHALKTLPDYFKALETGEKTFELRKNDRPFSHGDTLLAQEYDAESEKYTGCEIPFKITYILKDAKQFGLRDGYVVLGLQRKLEISNH